MKLSLEKQWPALLVLAVVIAFGLELLARTFFPYVAESDEALASVSQFTVAEGRRLIPNNHAVIHNHRLSHRDIDIRTNALGFRGPEVPVTKEKNEFRILVLGDSITWGDYLDESEIWVTRVQDYLQKNSSKTIRVMNAGVGDIGIQEEVDILNSTGIKSQPDLVVIAFYLNDSRPPWGFPQELGARGWFRRRSVFVDQIYQNFKLYEWARNYGEGRFDWVTAKDQLDWKSKPDDLVKLARLARFDWGAAWQDESWAVVQENFKKIKDLSEKNHFQVAVANLPVYFQVYAEHLDRSPQERVQKISEGMGFAYLDLLPSLRDVNSKEIFYDACHPMPWANDLIGKKVADFLLPTVN